MVLSYREALNQAMREEMRRDSSIFLIGEEVGYYQGAFKVSKGFVEEFGPLNCVSELRGTRAGTVKGVGENGRLQDRFHVLGGVGEEPLAAHEAR